jgi:hypothetical protein
MGSLDSATSGVATNASDNTAQETTLATIRSVSGDWDNAAVTTAPKLSSFTSSGTFIAPVGCTVLKITAIGAGGGGADSNGGDSQYYVGSGGSGASVMYMNELSGTGAHLHITIGGGGTGGTTHGSGTAGGSTLVKISDTTIITAGGGSGGVKGNSQSTAYGGVGGTPTISTNGYTSESNISINGGTGSTGRADDPVNARKSSPGGISSLLGGFSYHGVAQIGQGGVGGSSSTHGDNGGDGIVLIEW